MANNDGFKTGDRQELNKYLEQLRQAGLDRNKVTAAEFEHFRPLFEGSEDDSRNNELTRAFQERFNLYAPIVVMSDDSDEAEIVRIVPPLFQPTRSFNDIDDRAPETLTAMTKAFSRDEHPLRNDQQIAATRTLKHINKMQDEEEIERNQQLLSELMGGESEDDTDPGDELNWD